MNLFRSPSENSWAKLKFKGIFDPTSLRQGNGLTVTIENETVPIHPKFQHLISHQEPENENVLIEKIQQ